MVLLKLTVRATGVEPFAVEIEDEETVESLAVVIFSLQPEMGEDLRVAHKGRPLKAEKVLRDVGIVSGDVVAVARRPSPSASRPAPAAAAAAQDAAPATAPEPAIEKAIETAPDASLQAEKVVEAAKVVDAEEASTALVVEAPAAEVAGADGARSPSCSAEGEGQAVVAAGDAPEAAAPAPEEDEAGAPEAAAPEASQEDSTLEEGAPSAVLLALAQRLEYGAGDAHPGELAATLRRTAARVQALEGGISEFGHALQIVNLISAQALQGAGSQPDGTAGGRPNPYAPSSGEAPKSFLVKRGDAELQEAHRQAALRQPELKRQTSGGSTSSGGGALSTGAALSREEMDKARQARLAQLEAQQAQKKREQEEAAARSKAKEAMFQQPFVGPNKPLGKF